MCAIIDASVVRNLFGNHPTGAGKKFLHWVMAGPARLAIGGHLYEEMKREPNARSWFYTSVGRGAVHRIGEDKITERQRHLERTEQLRSNDAHVIALAQLSGARLLYSNDRKLNEDFRNKNIINCPSGHVYTTIDDRNGTYTPTHGLLLSKTDLCDGGCA